VTTTRPAVARRRLLAGLPVALFGVGAGCLGQPVSDDLIVRNLTGESRTVSIGVRTDDADLFAETVTIPAQDERSFEDPLPATGQFIVTVSVEGGPTERTDWESEDEGDTLSIRLTDEGIEFDADSG
jgi:hypothetical protein